MRDTMCALYRALRMDPCAVWWTAARAFGIEFRLEVVVEHELPGVRPQPDLVDLLGPLVVEPGFNEVVGENASLGQEVVIRLQRVQDRLQRRRYVLDVERLLGFEFVEVPVDRVWRLDFVPDPVEAG